VNRGAPRRGGRAAATKSEISAAFGKAPVASSSGFDGPVPNFNEERARTEAERKKVERQKWISLEIKNQVEAGKLVNREAFEMAFARVLSQLQIRASSLHLQLKIDIPSLTFEEVGLIEKRIANIFEDVADHEFEELPEEIDDEEGGRVND
jgi:phage terminase Nu1 subunit (DNA packaging protein)